MSVNNQRLHEVSSKPEVDKPERRSARPRKFQPFYEAVTADLPGPSSLIWKVGLSVALGTASFIPLLVTLGRGVFISWLWLVCGMITVALLCLYYATDTLRGLFHHMDSRLHQRGKPFRRAKQAYFRTVQRYLSDRNFLFAGLFFGIMNCAMGFIFGVSSEVYSLTARIAVYSSFFIIGFICGMATLGIYGILETVKEFVKAPQLELDYSAPDKCGGMRFLGEALVKFGAVTLIMGVLIAIFIVKFSWTRDNANYVVIIRWFWIVWPFALSLIVVLAPSAQISGRLSEYQVERQDELDEELAKLRTRARDSSLTARDREAARKDYEYYFKLREEVYCMSTWPYGIGSSVKYLSILIANAGAIGSAVLTSKLEKMWG